MLHHVEQLPWAAQHELADVLEKAAVNAKRPIHLEFMMEDGSYLADVRIVGTSELSPAELAQSKRIAPDLLRRLGKYHAAIPSLDQRKEDIPALAADILRRIALRTQMKAPPVLDKYAVALLEDTDWPHNISDLVRVLERAMVKCRKGTALTADVLREATGEYFQWTKSPKTWADQVAAFERKMILNETVLAGRTVEQAAKELKKNPKWLYRKIKDLGLDGEVGVRPSKVRKKIPLKKNGGYDPGADR